MARAIHFRGNEKHPHGSPTLRQVVLDDTHDVILCEGPVECLSGDTEFLTPTGWKRLDQYQAGDKVAVYDPRSGAIRHEYPRAYVDKPCEGFWKFSNAHSLSMVCSDEHRIPHYDYQGRWRIKTAAEMAAQPSRATIPTTFNVGGPGLVLSDEAIRLRVAVSADGCIPSTGNQVRMGLRKTRKKKRIRELLTADGRDWKEFQHSTRPTESTFAFDRSGIEKGFGPGWWQANSRQCEIIIDECLKWDGIDGKNGSRFDTTIKADAEFIQYAAHAIGGRATISEYDDPRNPDWSRMYSVHIAKPDSPKASVGLRVDHTKVERLEAGRKYCFSVSTGFFVARHNGCIFITGNSGKTTAMIGKLYKMMCTIPRCKDGIRRTKFIIVRPTYGELLETVVRDVLDWFPEEEYGEFKWSEPYRYTMKFLDVESEWHFMAFMDASETVLRKLRSTQFTAGWVNEGQYCPLRLFTEIIDRCGRYPPKAQCPNWNRRKRAFLDNNAPPKHAHWIRYMRGDIPLPAEMPDDQKMAYKKPAHWKFYKQPPAVLEVKDPGTGELKGYDLNPKAENLQWMGENAYLGNIAGKPRDQIDRDFRNITRPSRSGTPRYPMFQREYHVSPVNLSPNEGRPVILGMDFGLTPGVVFEQVIDGRWYTLWEHVADNEGAEELALSIKRILAERFSFHRESGLLAWGDPQGGWRGASSSSVTNTSFAILRAKGIPVKHPAKKDKPELRMNIGRKLLREGVNQGPRVMIDPRCVRLIEALDGGATMVTRSNGDATYVKEELDKNDHSHICEAWEYSKWGYGEGHDMIRGPEGNRGRGKVINTLGRSDVLGIPKSREMQKASVW